MTFLNLKPTLKGEAMLVIEVLTGDCEAIAKRILEAKTDRTRRGLIALFNERNETRCRIIDQFGLQTFAASLIN